jgi:hypothetical protein
MVLGSKYFVTEVDTRGISWGVKAAGGYGWQPYLLHTPIVLKSGSLKVSLLRDGIVNTTAVFRSLSTISAGLHVDSIRDGNQTLRRIHNKKKRHISLNQPYSLMWEEKLMASFCNFFYDTRTWFVFCWNILIMAVFSNTLAAYFPRLSVGLHALWKKERVRAVVKYDKSILLIYF